MISSRSNGVLAFLIALALHAALAAALAFYLSEAPAPDALPELDLSSVDLSFSETVEETASAAAASAPSEPQATPSTPRTPPPPEVVRRETADGMKIPIAEEPVLPSPADLFEVPPPKVERREMRDETPPPPAVAAAPRQAWVDAPPKPRRNIRPDYPRESRLRGEQGDVTLELTVTADGTVGDVRVVRSPGFPLLDEAAVKAARAARFTPAKSGGKSVASSVRLTLTFKLK